MHASNTNGYQYRYLIGKIRKLTVLQMVNNERQIRALKTFCNYK